MCFVRSCETRLWAILMAALSSCYHLIGALVGLFNSSIILSRVKPKKFTYTISHWSKFNFCTASCHNSLFFLLFRITRLPTITRSWSSISNQAMPCQYLCMLQFLFCNSSQRKVISLVFTSSIWEFDIQLQYVLRMVSAWIGSLLTAKVMSGRMCNNYQISQPMFDIFLYS